jgi:hypothetical protein
MVSGLPDHTLFTSFHPKKSATTPRRIHRNPIIFSKKSIIADRLNRKAIPRMTRIIPTINEIRAIQSIVIIRNVIIQDLYLTKRYFFRDPWVNAPMNRGCLNSVTGSRSADFSHSGPAA